MIIENLNLTEKATEWFLIIQLLDEGVVKGDENMTLKEKWAQANENFGYDELEDGMAIAELADAGLITLTKDEMVESVTVDGKKALKELAETSQEKKPNWFVKAVTSEKAKEIYKKVLDTGITTVTSALVMAVLKNCGLA